MSDGADELANVYALRDSAPSSVTMVTVSVNQTQAVYHDYANRRFELRYEARCHTCAHEKLHEINEAKVHGASTAAIIETFDLKVSRHSIDRHFRRHLPALRSVVVGMQALYKSVGLIEDEVKKVDPALVTQAVMQRGLSDLLRGDMEIKAADLLRAAAIDQELVRLEGAALSDAAYSEAIIILCEAVQSVMNDEEFARFMWRIRSHPRMRMILAQLDDRRSGAIEATAHESGVFVEVPANLAAAF